MTAAGLRTFAIESPVGRSLYAALHLLRASSASDVYLRAEALMRAWRASSHPFVAGRGSRFLDSVLTQNGKALPLRHNPLLAAFARSARAESLRREFGAYPLADRVRMRYPRTGEDPDRQGDLIILKRPDGTTGEKGVILIKYSEAVERFAALFDVARMVDHYAVVVEPSWWGYQDASFFLLAGSHADVIVQSQARSDFEFLERHGHGLTPVRLGAGDWIDPAVFSPTADPRQYDVVMVSSWNPFKRHEDLFTALAKLRREGTVLKTALVGYSNGWTVANIEEGLRRHGLSDQCDIFDAVPITKVADIVAHSRLYVLLSRREGANKAMYEAMFCDTPVLAPLEHLGINHDHLNAETGLAFRRGRLAEALADALKNGEQFAPRDWALRNTGFANATQTLNDVLSRMAGRSGRPWTLPIAAKKNQPNLRYATDTDRVALDPEYDRLADYLRPGDG